MPRVVDQRARRRQIVDAVWSVIADGGLESVSLRHVAHAAGVSVGLVQHYFSDKDEMVRCAVERLSDQVGARLARGTVAPAEQGDPMALVRAVLVDLLPLDVDRTLEARVTSAFLVRAAVDAGVAAQLRDGHRRRHVFLVSQLRRGGVDHPVREATRLVALVDGLTLHTLAGDHTPDSAVAIVDVELHRLLHDSVCTVTADGEVHMAAREAVDAAVPVGGGLS